MIYILETNLSEKQSICFSLTQIFGIGRFQSLQICKKLGFSANCRLSTLTPDQIAKLIPFDLNMTLDRALAEEKMLRQRYKAEEANQLMEDVLDQFKFKKGVMKLYEELVTLIYERNEKDNTLDLIKLKKSTSEL